MVAGTLVAALISAEVGSWAATALGNSDPGSAVRIGTSMLRTLTDLVAALTVGGLAYVVIFTRPRGDADTMPGSVTAPGYRALLWVKRWSVAWLVLAALLTAFTAVADAGIGLHRVHSLRVLWGLIRAQEEPLGWAGATAMIAVVAVAVRVVIRWRSAALLFAWALLATLAPLAGGHSSSEVDHDYATAAIWVHVPTALVWVGVLPLVLDQVRRRSRELPDVLRRYNQLAAVCGVVVVLSGVADALVLSPTLRLGSYDYVQVVGVKIVLLVAVVAPVIWWQRRVVTRLADPGATRRWLWIGGVQLLTLGVVMGLSAELTQLPPPAFLRPGVTIDQTLLGYDLTSPPTLARLLFDWRVELAFAALALVLAVLYLRAVLTLRRAGRAWPPSYTAGWLGGCLVLLLATSSGLARYEPAQFSMHMAGHMLVAFVAPILLVQGAPLTLARTMLATRGVDHGRGSVARASDWLDLADRSPVARALTHPVVALTLLVGSPFLLYFTAAFDEAARFHWAAILLDGYFLVAGYVFFWPVIGTDPPPRQVPNLVRLGMLLAATPFATVFAGLVIATPRVIGNGYYSANMYTALGLPWVHSLAADQRWAGVVALVIGEASLFAAVIVLLVRWSRVDEDLLSVASVVAARRRAQSARGRAGGGDVAAGEREGGTAVV